MGPKLATLCLVVVSWLLITAKQGGIVTVTVPIKFHNLPASLALMSTTPEEVDVQLKAMSSLIPSPGKLDITADLDLAKIRDGVNHLALQNDNFKLPLGVTVLGVSPATIKVTAEKKVRRELMVRVRKGGVLPRGVHLRSINAEPGMAVVEGPEHLLTRLESVDTEEVNLSVIHQSMVVEARLVSPAPQVQVPDGSVRVRIITAPQ